MVTAGVDRARAVAESVTDPELPLLTLAELGVLREVRTDPEGRVVVSITPTYTGCPALESMRDDLRARLRAAGFAEVDVRTVLAPAWTTDWITESGRRKLAAAGIAPPGTAQLGTAQLGTAQLGTAQPGTAPRRSAGPIPLRLGPTRVRVECPRCGSADTDELSRFGATACRSLHRCNGCREPFEHFKEL